MSPEIFPDLLRYFNTLASKDVLHGVFDFCDAVAEISVPLFRWGHILWLVLTDRRCTRTLEATTDCIVREFKDMPNLSSLTFPATSRTLPHLSPLYR